MKKNYILFVLVALFGVANLSFAAQTVKLRVQVPAETKVVAAASPISYFSVPPSLFIAIEIETVGLVGQFDTVIVVPYD